jgi:hypothetical protein
MKLLSLLYINKFEISAAQCTTHYSPMGNGNVLDIGVHNKDRRPEVTISDILDSDHLPTFFHILDHVRTTRSNPSDLVDKFTNWERFQNLASELISPRIKINSGEEANKAAHDFTISILLASKITLSDLITICLV